MNLTVLEGELCHVFPKSAWKEWQRKASRDCQNGCWKWKWVLSGVNILVVNHMVSQKNEKKKNSNLIRQRSDCFDENTINKKMIFLVKPCSLHHFSKMRFIPYFHPSFCRRKSSFLHLRAQWMHRALRPCHIRQVYRLKLFLRRYRWTYFYCKDLMVYEDVRDYLQIIG